MVRKVIIIAWSCLTKDPPHYLREGRYAPLFFVCFKFFCRSFLLPTRYYPKSFGILCEISGRLCFASCDREKLIIFWDDVATVHFNLHTVIHFVFRVTASTRATSCGAVTAYLFTAHECAVLVFRCVGHLLCLYAAIMLGRSFTTNGLISGNTASAAPRTSITNTTNSCARR